MTVDYLWKQKLTSPFELHNMIISILFDLKIDLTEIFDFVAQPMDLSWGLPFCRGPVMVLRIVS